MDSWTSGCMYEWIAGHVHGWTDGLLVDVMKQCTDEIMTDLAHNGTTNGCCVK